MQQTSYLLRIPDAGGGRRGVAPERSICIGSRPVPRETPPAPRPISAHPHPNQDGRADCRFRSAARPHRRQRKGALPLATGSAGTTRPCATALTAPAYASQVPRNVVMVHCTAKHHHRMRVKLPRPYTRLACDFGTHHRHVMEWRRPAFDCRAAVVARAVQSWWPACRPHGNSRRSIRDRLRTR